MSKSLPLDEMTVEEKLQTMETIWDDLTDNADNIQSPEWHDKILIDREKKLNNGSEEIIDWSVAKRNQRVRPDQRVRPALWHYIADPIHG